MGFDNKHNLYCTAVY